MKLFRKKEKITFWTEEEKLAFVEKLEKAHIEYDLREDRDVVAGEHAAYVTLLSRQAPSKSHLPSAQSRGRYPSAKTQTSADLSGSPTA